MRNDHRPPPEPIVVIGVAGCKRIAAFAEAALRLGFAPVQTVSYLDWIEGRFRPPHECVLRLESPGGCPSTTRAILAAGIAAMESRGAEPVHVLEIDRLECDRGELLHPLQWYLGYREILARLAADLAGPPKGATRWMSQPAAIATAFDKLACLERWSQAGLPVPPRYPRVSTYEQLRHEIPEPHARLFVKLRYGYSALGAMALEWRGRLVRAITTMEFASAGGRTRLFVSKRPRVLGNEMEIAWLFDELAKEEVLVEAWLPKARWRGRPYDIRAVMIDGRLHHLVGRANASPFTNLNLDASRVPRQTIEHHLGPAWPRFVELCEQAAACIPGARCLGLDVLVRPCRRRFVLLEANAFGDYLPGLLHRGLSTYEAQLLALCAAPGVAA